MKKTIVIAAFAALCAPVLFACDKPGATEQQKEMKANEQLDQTRNDSEKSAENAQAAADKQIAAAQADFDRNREDYRHARAQDLTDLDKKISDLEAKARTSTCKTRADLSARLPAIHAQRDTFVRDMQSTNATTGATWDDAKTRLDKEWDALKAMVDKS